MFVFAKKKERVRTSIKWDILLSSEEEQRVLGNHVYEQLGVSEQPLVLGFRVVQSPFRRNSLFPLVACSCAP